MVSLDGTPGGAVSVTEPLPPPIGRSTLVSISVMGPTDSSGEILISANEESTSMTAWFRAIAPSLSQTCINSPEDLMPSIRSEEHTSELQSLMRISYAVFCLKKQKKQNVITK